MSDGEDWTAHALVALDSAGLREIRAYIHDLHILYRRALKRAALLSEITAAPARCRSPLFGVEQAPSNTWLQSLSSATARSPVPSMSDVATSHDLVTPRDADAYSPTPLTTSREPDQKTRLQPPSPRTEDS
jgi:hypothetical protein